MKLSRLTIVLFVFLCQHPVMAQLRYKQFAKRIAKADSVVAYSHVTVKEFHLKEELLITVTEPVPAVYPLLLLNGTINPAVVVERKKLDPAWRKRLSALIGESVPPSNISSVSMCFEPHHGLAVYSGGKMSYVEICFTCGGIETSSDLNLDISDFKKGKWQRLRRFYGDAGLQYHLK